MERLRCGDMLYLETCSAIVTWLRPSAGWEGASRIELLPGKSETADISLDEQGGQRRSIEEIS